MTRKIVWIVVSFLAALSFLLASCAPTSPTTTAPATTTTAPTTTGPTTPTTTAPAAVTPSAEKPKYGGRITYAQARDVQGFDQTFQTVGWSVDVGQHLAYDRLLVGDWTIGAAGTNETDFAATGWAPEGIFRETGALAESWEVPDSQTMIFHIRQGVRFHNKPPVNGREMDANDVAFSINYMYLNPKNPNAYNIITAPGGKRLLSAKALDKWTVEVKVEDYAWAFFEDVAVKGVHIVAPEVVQQFGDLKNWRNAVGTGGFQLTDYVPGSSLFFSRNPNYWKTNPIGPGKGDQLPYVDNVNVLIMPDKSTAIAAFRTGKIDALGLLGPRYGHPLGLEDKDGIVRTNPQTKVKRYPGSMDGVGIRLTSTDPLAKPLLNQKVRWALSMAIDREEMIRDLYGGEAEKYSVFFPVNSPYYKSPDQMPEILERVFGMKPEDALWAKKLWEYNPAEAKKMLAEAGYPNGFKTSVVGGTAHTDYLSILKAYWEKNLNVELQIDARELAIYQQIIDAHTTPAMFYYTINSIGTNPAKFVFYGPGDPTLPFTVSNRWELSDPRLDKYIQKINADYGVDLEVQNRKLGEIESVIVWLAPWIATPGKYNYTVWNPWLKNFYGYESIGFRGHANWTYFAWVDQDLKKSMGK